MTITSQGINISMMALKNGKLWLSLALVLLSVIGLICIMWYEVRQNNSNLKADFENVKDQLVEVGNRIANVKIKIKNAEGAAKDKLDGIQDQFDDLDNAASATESRKLKQRVDDLEYTYPVNCEAIYQRRRPWYRGIHRIDPDGKGFGVEPFDVFCDIEIYYETEYDHYYRRSYTRDRYRAVTRVIPVNPGPFVIKDNLGNATFRMEFAYTNATLDQVAALADSSASCGQNIKFDCYMTKLSHQGVWLSRDGEEQTYFDGANFGKFGCGCSSGDFNTCAASGSEGGGFCNCDQKYPMWREDTGVITNKTALPIVGFVYNMLDFDAENQNATMGIGPLECKGLSNNGQGHYDWSCKDLKQHGRPTGLYVLRKTKTDYETRNKFDFKLVRCDMSVAEDSPNFEVNLGDLATKHSLDMRLNFKREDITDGNAIRFSNMTVDPVGIVELYSNSTTFKSPWSGNFTLTDYPVGKYDITVKTGDEWKVVLRLVSSYTYGGGRWTPEKSFLLNRDDEVKIVRLGGQLHDDDFFCYFKIEATSNEL